MQRMARQKGYATIFTMLLFVAFALAAFSMFDVGQVSSERIRIQNTSDAAAHSAAALLARDLNFTAYTNRAMVANQAAIGQLVALASWTNFLEQEAINLDRVATFTALIPGIGPLIKQVTQTVRQFAVQLSSLVDSLATAGISVTEGVIGVLSRAQQTYHEAAYVAALGSIAGVIQANDPDINFGVADTVMSISSFADAWRNHTRQNSPNLGQGRRIDNLNRFRFQEKTALIMRSRDEFTRNRNDRWLNAGVGIYRARIDKYGGTELTMHQQGNRLGWDWTSMDTESFWFGQYGWRGTPPRWRLRWNEVLPLGWGAAHALDENDDYNYRRSGRWNNSWANPRAARLAQAMDRGNNLTNISGLRSYRDFHENNDPAHNRGLRPGDTSRTQGVVIYLVKEAARLGTRKNFVDSIPGQTAGTVLDVQEQGGLAGDQLTGVAKAEAYFSRPRNLWSRRDGRIEHGNMYNPYWQVRLIEPSASEMLRARLLSGVN